MLVNDAEWTSCHDLRTRLHADHREVARLIDELLVTEDFEIVMRERLRDQIAVDLLATARAEEEVVYDFLAQHTAIQDELRIAFRQHEEICRLVALMQRMHGGDSHLDLVVEQLKESIQAHLHDKETVLLPEAEKTLGAERLGELGTLFYARRTALRAELHQRPPSERTPAPMRFERQQPLEESDTRF